MKKFDEKIMKKFDEKIMKRFDENLWKSLIKTPVWWKFMDKFGEKLMNKKRLWSKVDEKLINLMKKCILKLNLKKR